MHDGNVYGRTAAPIVPHRGGQQGAPADSNEKARLAVTRFLTKRGETRAIYTFPEIVYNSDNKIRMLVMHEKAAGADMFYISAPLFV